MTGQSLILIQRESSHIVGNHLDLICTSRGKPFLSFAFRIHLDIPADEEERRKQGHQRYEESLRPALESPEQEEKVKSEKESRLDSLADTIAAAATEYMHLTCPDVDFEVSGAEMRETLDEMLPLLDLFKNITVKVTSIPVTAKDKPAKTPEDVFAKFFRNLGI